MTTQATNQIVSAFAAKASEKVASRKTIYLGTVGLRNTATNDVVCKTTLPGPGRLIKFWCYTSRKSASGSQGAGVFNLKLDGTQIGIIGLTTSTSVSGCGGFCSGTSTNTINSSYTDGAVATVTCKTATTAWSSSGTIHFYADVYPPTT